MANAYIAPPPGKVRVALRHLRGLAVAWLTFAAVGCGSAGPEPFVDFSAFEQLPALSDLDPSVVQASSGIEYWELRSAWSPDDETVLLSGGSVAKGDLGPDILAALDSVLVFGGFAFSCLPGGCYHYYVTADSTGAVETWTEAESIPALFAPVGSPTEAALIAHAQGFHWSLPIETGAFRRAGDAWQLVVTKLVQGCDPVQVDRFLLEVDEAGVVTELKREVYSREDDICI